MSTANTLKVFHDRVGQTLTVWFGNPEDEFEAEETGDEVILMKDREGRTIGFEKLNFVAADSMPTNPERLALESEDAQTVLNLMEDQDRWDEALEISRGLVSGTIDNPWNDNTVRHYYSPRSMDLPGSAPAWVIPSQEVDVPAVPDERFRWYRGIL